MRQPAKKTSVPSRPLVGIAVDGVSSFGRGIMRGAMQYINAQRRWEIYTAFRRTYEPQMDWPKCQGAIFGGIGPQLRDLILQRTRHIVSCSGSADPKLFTVVCLDDLAVGAMAAEHLMECRLENFSFYGDRGSLHSNNREQGFIESLAQRGHNYIPCPIAYYVEQLEGLPHWPAFIDWLVGLPKPVGILALDDSAALDLAAACRHANLGVPEHVAIVGVNNDDLICDSAWSPLSSVDCGFTRIGYTAAQVLDRLLQGEKLKGKKPIVRLPPLQVVRRISTDILAVDDLYVADAVRYIREHACDPCSVDDILRHVPTGRRWLERAFEKKLGRSPREEILRVQLETAKRLLLQPGLILPDIAERCGFSGAPTLGRAFLRTFKTTPAAYRRESLRRQ